jgi:hypothetical protein
VRKKDDPLTYRAPTRMGQDLGVFVDKDEIDYIESLRQTYAQLQR